MTKEVVLDDGVAKVVIYEESVEERESRRSQADVLANESVRITPSQGRLLALARVRKRKSASDWCGKPLDWGGKTKDSLVVDHLDGYGDNNEPANLVPSCLRCNSSRAIKEKCDANEGRWWNGEGADAVRRTLPPRKT